MRNSKQTEQFAIFSSPTANEVTFWGVTGQKLATYQIQVGTNALQMTQTGTNYYFGSKLIKNAGGYVVADRLGSIGKFYPWGQEKPSATTNGTEKFTGYFRDAETGLDYADQRFHNPGTGRFMTADPYMASGGPADPGSWNRYAYTRGDPVNRVDRTGLDDCSAYRDAYACPYALDSGGGGGDTCTLDPVTFEELCPSGDSCYGDDFFSSSACQAVGSGPTQGPTVGSSGPLPCPTIPVPTNANELTATEAALATYGLSQFINTATYQWNAKHTGVLYQITNVQGFQTAMASGPYSDCFYQDNVGYALHVGDVGGTVTGSWRAFKGPGYSLGGSLQIVINGSNVDDAVGYSDIDRFNTQDLGNLLPHVGGLIWGVIKRAVTGGGQ